MRSFIPNCLLRPVLVAGFCAAPFAVAITPADLSARLARNERVLVVDVRSSTAYTEGHVPGAINIPLSLLPHKQLPASQLVVIYGDGLGVVDDAKTLAVVKAKPGVTADLLEGGYAAWLAEIRLTTSSVGVNPEKIPGITYDQLVAAGKDDVVLVDLRAPAPAVTTVAARTTAGGSKSGTTSASAAPAPDVLDAFSRKISVPLVVPTPEPTRMAARGKSVATVAPSTSSRAAAAVESLDKSGKLLVLVADNEAEANEAARQLRAQGHYRFTVLIGGTEAIRHEGKTGSGRMDAGLLTTPSQP